MVMIRKLREVLFSSQTPPFGATLWDKPFHTSVVVRRVEGALGCGRFVALIYLDLVGFRELERSLGPVVARGILSCMENALQAFAPALPPGAQIAIQNLWGDDFAVYVILPERPAPQWLDDLAHALIAAVRGRVRREYPTLDELQVHLAHTLIDGQGGVASSLIYQALQRAMQVAKGTLSPEAVSALGEFQELVSTSLLRSVYQPIVSLASGSVLGWEALIRGPEGTRFQNPEALFRFAEEYNQMWHLERACRQAAITDLTGLACDQKLFLNVNPQTINDPHFTGGETMALVQSHGLQPHNIVFEITERTWIKDFPTFRRTLEHYRSQGYLVAIDDLGAGYSSLQSVAELRPDFIKLDMSLIKGIHASSVLRAIVETFVTFAVKTGCGLIAEGIETREELRALADLGVPFGQGYHLARPGTPPPNPTDTARNLILRISREPRHRQSLDVPVDSLVESAVVVGPETLVREVADLLKADEGLEGVVVVDGTQPIGVIMRDRLFRQLGKPYGIALHYDRPVSSMMYQGFLMTETGMTLEQVSRQVMSRELGHRYDYVVAVEGRAYRGVISVHRLLLYFTDAKLTMARHANPLTGMSGNHVIHDELMGRLKSGHPFTVIYADLDAFKAFNDVYGFQAGDKVLLFAARLIARMTAKYGEKSGFVGHVGGDDFVIIVEPEHAEPLCRHLIGGFDRLVPRFYSLEERKAKQMQGYDRFGARAMLPLISISLAGVDVTSDRYAMPDDISRAAAQVKRQTKAQPGSAFVRA